MLVGRGSGIARAVALTARDAGARVVAACAARGERNPARRIGTADDVADAVLFALTNTFLTGVTLAVDGGESLT